MRIDWGASRNKPIFTITNMAPGQSEEHTVKVYNRTERTIKVRILGKKRRETGNLASVLDIKISTNNKDVYGGTSRTGPKTLRQFLNGTQSTPISPSNLKPNNDASYVVTVSFKKSAGNEFQTKNITFDLDITPATAAGHDCKNSKDCKDGDQDKNTANKEKEDNH